jgi:hypothetical protein
MDGQVIYGYNFIFYPFLLLGRFIRVFPLLAFLGEMGLLHFTLIV